MTDRAIEQYLDIKVSISVSISIKIYLSNLNNLYLFRPYSQSCPARASRMIRQSGRRTWRPAGTWGSIFI